MKKLLTLLTVFALSGTYPCFAAEGSKDDAATQIKNVQVGAREASAGWVEIFDGVASAESKSSNTAEKFTGFIAGTGIGTRKAIHRTASGLFGLATFWIPKKEPLLTPTPKDDTSKQYSQNFSHK